jgi:hypothetical protein
MMRLLGVFADAAQRHRLVECGCVAVDRVRTGDELTTIEGVASDLELISRLPGWDSPAAEAAQGTPGFTKFVGILDAQAERLRTDLTDLGDKLRAAADVNDKQDHEAGGALDSSVRYG